MIMVKANILKVKVYPKDLKSIPDILPFNKLIHGDPVELELNKKEIWRCMHFGDVFDMTSGEEVLIDRPAFNKIEEFIEDETEAGDETTDDNTGNGENSSTTTPEGGNTEETPGTEEEVTPTV